jgi:hypothetical protein
MATTGRLHIPRELTELEECYQRVISLNDSLAQRYRSVAFGETTQ